MTDSNAVFDVSSEKTELLQGLFAKKSSDEEPRHLPDDLGYGGWCARAKKFVREFNELPGEHGVSIDIAPPVDGQAFDERVAGFTFQVPETLRRFSLEGSGDFKGTYVWRPDKATLKELESLLPYQDTLWGGAEITVWNELASEPGYYCSWEEEEDAHGRWKLNSHRDIVLPVPLARGSVRLWHLRWPRPLI